MQFLCECGKVITDRTDNLRYKALYREDKYYELFEGSICNDIQDFIKAIKTKNKNIWIKQYFSKDYPTDLEYSGYISEFLLAIA